MKSVLVIGLGRFGRHLCLKLTQLGNEVMIVDKDEAAVTELANAVTSAQIADCTDEAALHALGVPNFDVCFVCIGSDFASSLLITSLLKDLGAQRIIAKSSQDMHMRLLLRNGADEVVYPERDSAERVAMRTSATNVFDYIELTDEYAIYEIPPLASWVGKTIMELGIRNRYHINILAVKTGDALRPMPGANYAFTGTEHILALAGREDVKKLLRKVESNSSFE